MKRIVLAAMLLLFAATTAWAQSEGEVRKVDKDAQKITIKHGPLKNLDMPAMTMVFKVKDPAMLERVKAGDKVKFQAENLGGALTVTEIAPAK
ncbi:MAG: copper-binding protein [Betaproteobacteria bacterium]|nr:MAG: copper-binding protein [Betaproteobacteria bacterium]